MSDIALIQFQMEMDEEIAAATDDQVKRLLEISQNVNKDFMTEIRDFNFDDGTSSASSSTAATKNSGETKENPENPGNRSKKSSLKSRKNSQKIKKNPKLPEDDDDQRVALGRTRLEQDII